MATDWKPLEDLDWAVPLESVQDGAAFGQARRGRRDVDEERPSSYKLDRLAAEPARGHCDTIETGSWCNGERGSCGDRLFSEIVVVVFDVWREREEQKLKQELELAKKLLNSCR